MNRREFVGSSLGLLGVPSLSYSLDNSNKNIIKEQPLDEYIKNHKDNPKVLINTLNRGITRFLEDDKLKLLMVLMPPRTHKTSIFTEHLPFYLTKLNHNIKITSSSYCYQMADWYRKHFKLSNVNYISTGSAICGRSHDIFIGDDLIRRSYDDTIQNNYKIYNWINCCIKNRFKDKQKLIIVGSLYIKGNTKDSFYYKLWENYNSNEKLLGAFPINLFESIDKVYIRNQLSEEMYNSMYNIDLSAWFPEYELRKKY